MRIVPVSSVKTGSPVVLMGMTRPGEKVGVLVCLDGLGDAPIPWDAIGAKLANGGAPFRRDPWCPMTEGEASWAVLVDEKGPPQE